MKKYGLILIAFALTGCAFSAPPMIVLEPQIGVIKTAVAGNGKPVVLHIQIGNAVFAPEGFASVLKINNIVAVPHNAQRIALVEAYPYRLPVYDGIRWSVSFFHKLKQ